MSRFGSGKYSQSANRKAAAKAILRDIHATMVCEGCGSIVLRIVVRCPQCEAYRFDESPERIRRVALALANKKPEPLSYHPLDTEDEAA